MKGFSYIRKEVPNGGIFRFVCLESVVCDLHTGSRPRHGRSAVAPPKDLSGRPVPARVALHARSRPEMPGEALAQRLRIETRRAQVSLAPKSHLGPSLTCAQVSLAPKSHSRPSLTCAQS